MDWNQILQFIAVRPRSAEELFLLICFVVILFTFIGWMAFAIVEKFAQIIRRVRRIRDYITF
jgi:hypothetical protein